MMFLHDTFEGNGREGPCEKINLSTVVPVLSLFHRKAPFLGSTIKLKLYIFGIFQSKGNFL